MDKQEKFVTITCTSGQAWNLTLREYEAGVVSLNCNVQSWQRNGCGAENIRIIHQYFTNSASYLPIIL